MSRINYNQKLIDIHASLLLGTTRRDELNRRIVPVNPVEKVWIEMQRKKLDFKLQLTRSQTAPKFLV